MQIRPALWINAPIEIQQTRRGSTTVTFELRDNLDQAFRTGTLTIGGQTFTVIQEGAGGVECSNSISPMFGSFTAAGGSSSIDVIANKACVWSAVSNSSWVVITSNASGTGVGVVTYTVGGNAGTSARKGTITIAGQTFSIKQSGSALKGGSL